MRSQNQAAALFDGQLQRGQRFADARVVGDDAVLEWHVEVHADENALAAEVEIVDGQFRHGFSVEQKWLCFNRE